MICRVSEKHVELAAAFENLSMSEPADLWHHPYNSLPEGVKNLCRQKEAADKARLNRLVTQLTEQVYFA
jgi:hypothetical protein